MSFVSNEMIKEAIRLELRDASEIVDFLPSIDEIREVDYQGTTFSYPCVRIRIITNVPSEFGCFHKITFGIQVYSEKDSSKQSEELSGIIASKMLDVAFTRNGVTISSRVTNIVPALRTDRLTWMTEVLMSGIAS